MGFQSFTKLLPLRAFNTAARIEPIWFSCLRREAAAAETLHLLKRQYADGTCMHEALFEGYWAVRDVLAKTVEEIRVRGGLLLIGGAA